MNPLMSLDNGDGHYKDLQASAQKMKATPMSSRIS